MQVRYVGPFDVVYVPTLDAEVAHDGVVDVPDALGASLLEQPDNWQPVKAAKATKAEEV